MDLRFEISEEGVRSCEGCEEFGGVRVRKFKGSREQEFERSEGDLRFGISEEARVRVVKLDWG